MLIVYFTCAGVTAVGHSSREHTHTHTQIINKVATAKFAHPRNIDWRSSWNKKAKLSIRLGQTVVNSTQTVMFALLVSILSPQELARSRGLPSHDYTGCEGNLSASNH